ncbi:hypothetical protein [Saccharopolyspora sp. NPDC002376]
MTSTVDMTPSRWAVPVLGFGTFAVGTCEFVLAGLLPQLSKALDVSIGAAGQVVTAFALTCALLAPVLATATASWQRRRVLVVLATTLIAFTAVYLPYTYIGAVFGPATGGSGVRLAVLMFLLGVIGTSATTSPGCSPTGSAAAGWWRSHWSGWSSACSCCR